MKKKNKVVTVTIRMTELDLTKLEYLQTRYETRSATIRRLIDDAWFATNMASEAENRFNVTDYLPPNI